jgi:hypothetical protein
MYTVEMFIGQNNETQVLELETLKDVLNKRHDGYTIQVVTGAWRGSEEDTARVLLSDNKNKILDTIKQLKKLLNQEAIAFHEVTPLEFI